MMYKHVMGDIETLDTSPKAVVLSVGYVLFNLEDEDSYDTLNDQDRTAYAVLEMDSQLEAGRTVSASTISWWMDQNVLAKQVFSAKKIDTETALNLTDAWIRRSKAKYLWGNGSSFDNTILKSLHDDFRLEFPFPYWDDRDLRTLKHLAGSPKLGIEKSVEHNALDDAKYQVLCAQEYYRRLKA